MAIKVFGNLPVPYFDMLSIIIPTLNEEKYLPRLLEAIKGQDFFDYEMIVSDGGSSDQTVMIANKFSARVVIDGRIKHPSAQRNNGMAIAQGEIFLFLDADSVIEPGFLKIADEQFREKKLTAAGFYLVFNPNRWYYNFYSFISNTICLVKQLTAYPAAVGAGMMVSRSAYEKIGGFDVEVALAEDYDYCARLSKIGKFRMINGCRLLYSSRRLEKEGFWRTGWKWFKMGIFTFSHRKIKKQIVKYDFGKF